MARQETPPIGERITEFEALLRAFDFLRNNRGSAPAATVVSQDKPYGPGTPVPYTGVGAGTGVLRDPMATSLVAPGNEAAGRAAAPVVPPAAAQAPANPSTALIAALGGGDAQVAIPRAPAAQRPDARATQLANKLGAAPTGVNTDATNVTLQAMKENADRQKLQPNGYAGSPTTDAVIGFAGRLGQALAALAGKEGEGFQGFAGQLAGYGQDVLTGQYRRDLAAGRQNELPKGLTASNAAALLSEQNTRQQQADAAQQQYLTARLGLEGNQANTNAHLQDAATTRDLHAMIALLSNETEGARMAQNQQFHMDTMNAKQSELSLDKQRLELQKFLGMLTTAAKTGKDSSISAKDYANALNTLSTLLTQSPGTEEGNLTKQLAARLMLELSTMPIKGSGSLTDMSNFVGE